MTYEAIVEIGCCDPNGLRRQCEEACNEWLLGEPEGMSAEEMEAKGEELLARFLSTIHPRTTGADALSVTVVPYMRPVTNREKHAVKYQKAVVVFGGWTDVLESEFAGHARLFETQPGVKGRWEWRDTGIRTEYRSTLEAATQDGRDLAAREGAVFFGWGRYLDGVPVEV